MGNNNPSASGRTNNTLRAEFKPYFKQLAKKYKINTHSFSINKKAGNTYQISFDKLAIHKLDHSYRSMCLSNNRPNSKDGLRNNDNLKEYQARLGDYLQRQLSDASDVASHFNPEKDFSIKRKTFLCRSKKPFLIKLGNVYNHDGVPIREPDYNPSYAYRYAAQKIKVTVNLTISDNNKLVHNKIFRALNQLGNAHWVGNNPPFGPKYVKDGFLEGIGAAPSRLGAITGNSYLIGSPFAIQHVTRPFSETNAINYTLNTALTPLKYTGLMAATGLGLLVNGARGLGNCMCGTPERARTTACVCCIGAVAAGVIALVLASGGRALDGMNCSGCGGCGDCDCNHDCNLGGGGCDHHLAGGCHHCGHDICRCDANWCNSFMLGCDAGNHNYFGMMFDYNMIQNNGGQVNLDAFVIGNSLSGPSHTNNPNCCPCNGRPIRNTHRTNTTQPLLDRPSRRNNGGGAAAGGAAAGGNAEICPPPDNDSTGISQEEIEQFEEYIKKRIDKGLDIQGIEIDSSVDLEKFIGQAKQKFGANRISTQPYSFLPADKERIYETGAIGTRCRVTDVPNSMLKSNLMFFKVNEQDYPVAPPEDKNRFQICNGFTAS